MTIFLSYLLGCPVWDTRGQRVGSLKDLVVHQEAESLPEVSGIILQRPGMRVLVSMEHVTAFDQRDVRLRVNADALPTTPADEDQVYLKRDLLDAQVVDVNGAKVVRVNDILLSPGRDLVLVSGLDIGPWGLLRRLGWAMPVAWLARRTGFKLAEGVIPWGTIEPIAKDPTRVQLKVSQEKLVGLHPADLAEIVEELGPQQRLRLYEEMSDEQLADLIEEAEPALQSSILYDLHPERAADVLEEMEPDEAADLLAELPSEEAQSFMHLMEPEEAAEVRQLLAYEEDTAGAMMTTSFLAVGEEATIADAVRWFREHEPEAEVVAYFYLQDVDGRLTGVTSVRRILLAEDWNQPMAEISHPQPFRVDTEASRREVAELVSRYNLTAVPVVDAQERLVGVVSVHDVLEEALGAA